MEVTKNRWRYAGTRTVAQYCKDGPGGIRLKDDDPGGNEREQVKKWLELPSDIWYCVVETFHLKVNDDNDGDFALVVLLENHQTRELVKVYCTQTLEKNLQYSSYIEDGYNIYILRCDLTNDRNSGMFSDEELDFDFAMKKQKCICPDVIEPPST